MAVSVLAGSFLFDPLGFSEDVEMFEIMKVREIKNGRLAMVAWAAFFVQVCTHSFAPKPLLPLEGLHFDQIGRFSLLVRLSLLCVCAC